MQFTGISAGIAAAAFWGFVAIVSVAGIWAGTRKREVQHETLQRMIERGNEIDPALVQKVLSSSAERLDRDLLAGGLILLLAAPGLAILGWFLSFATPEALMPLLGVSMLVACVSAGLLIAGKVIGRASRRESRLT